MKPDITTKHTFLSGGGEMGELIRAYDWTKTPVGSPDTWPQSLKTTLSIILNSRFPMFLFWGNELLCFYNDAYRPSLGNNGKHPYALGKPATEVWPEIWDTIKPLIDQVMELGEATWSEDQLIPIYRNGKIDDVYWTFSYSPVSDETGAPAGVFVTCTETTDKVVNMNRLAESRDLLKFAVEAAELGTWDYNPTTNKFTANARLSDWFGFSTTTDIPLSSAISAIAEADKERVIMAINQALTFESGGQYNIEYTVIHPETKKERIICVKGRAWFRADKTVYRFNGTMQEITEAKRAEQTLRESEARFRSLVEEAPVATCLYVGRDLIIDVANDIMLGYWGKGRTVLGKPLAQALPELEGQPFLQILNDIFATGQTFEAKAAKAELVVDNVLGTYYFDYTYKPLRNTNGDIYAIMNVAVDVTQQVMARQKLEASEARYRALSAELEQQVQARTEELETINEELTVINEELASTNAELLETNELFNRSNKNLEQFAYVASHDLQEPLRKIQSFGDLLLKQYETQLGEGVEYLQRMQSGAARMSILIKDLLAFSRVANRQDATDAVSLNDVVATVLNDLELTIEETKADIRIDGLPTIQGDASQLGQLFQNLLSNALKFHQDGVAPVIQVSSRKLMDDEMPATVKPARWSKTYYQIDVADNGIGFDPKYADRIFQVFQRLHGKIQYSGTGIGLAICEKVVSNHGGAITVYSQPGQGSTFSVYLPV